MTFLKLVLYPFQIILDLCFPHVCLHCLETLNDKHLKFCIKCSANLVFTDFDRVHQNEAFMRMQQLVSIENGGCLLYFTKGEVTQSLVHALKYKGRQDIGIYLGKLIGEKLKQQKAYANINQIIPVPLHSQKKRVRGYNQAECIAQGISTSTNIPIVNNILIRKANTATQTQKTKEERLQNMKDVFAINNLDKLSTQHILLVDDVLTTGATLLYCIKALKQYTPANISFYCVAFATT